MNVVFRVDSSSVIGTGHVFRCLALAKKLRENQCNVFFISRKMDGAVIEQISNAGFAIGLLPTGDPEYRCPSNNEYERWLQVSWNTDARQTICLIEKWADSVDWLIIDHYGLDYRWMKLVREKREKLCV